MDVEGGVSGVDEIPTFNYTTELNHDKYFGNRKKSDIRELSSKHILENPENME